MRTLLLLLFSILCYAGQPMRRANVYGAEHGYRGHDVWIRVGASWWDAEPATIDPKTNYVKVPSRTYSGTEYIAPLSDGALPGGLSPSRIYKACFIDKNRFKFVSQSIGGCGNEAIITDVGSGNLFVGVQRAGPARAYMKDLVLPPGVTVKEMIGTNNLPIAVSGGKYVGNNTQSIFLIHLEIAPGAPLEQSEIRATIENAGFPDITLKKPFQVRELVPVTITPPTKFPAIPGKAKWESTMLTLASKWCDPDTGTLRGPGVNGVMSFGVEFQVWFYDGAWVYRQVAAYTGDSRWLSCARSIASQYRDYILGAGGAPGYRIFTDGLKSECQSCDGRYRVAIKVLAENGPHTLVGGQPQDDGDREVSYLLETALNAVLTYGFNSLEEIPTTGTWPRIKTNILRSSTMLLGMLDTKRGNNYIYNQTFMTGIVMDALIRYWEFTKDPRVPAEIKETLDFIWNKLWLPASPPNTLIYNISPKGGRCDYNCYPSGETSLINLTAPAFAWYWSITGDDTYRQRGDTLFQHSLDTDISFSGKIFSQNYRRSFDYVLWREGKRPYRP